MIDLGIRILSGCKAKTTQDTIVLYLTSGWMIKRDDKECRELGEVSRPNDSSVVILVEPSDQTECTCTTVHVTRLPACLGCRATYEYTVLRLQYSSNVRCMKRSICVLAIHFLLFSEKITETQIN